MKERPILFSAPMVRAILAGTKTQTRRALRVQPPATTDQVSTWHHPDPRPHYFAWVSTGDGGAEISDWPALPCPYGQPGDRLWVREAWARNADQLSDSHMNTSIVYRADNKGRALDNGGEKPWRPSIHMPRWASRITLEVTDVRVDRLHDISAKDIIAEGSVERPHIDNFGRNPVSRFDGKVYLDLRSLWAAGWEKINGAGSWSANPLVWVVEFKRVGDEIDRRAA